MKAVDTFDFPQDKAIFARFWMTPAEAATLWACSRSTAYRLIQRHPEAVGQSWVWIQQGNNRKLVMVVSRRATRPTEAKGNPLFRSKPFQRDIARKREEQRKTAQPME